MAITRADLRALVRREVQDTGTPPLWTDAQIHDALAAGLQAYSQYFPEARTMQATSSANQTTLVLGTAPVAVTAVTVDGVTVLQVPDAATLYEPAFANFPSQTTVQPVAPFGVAGTHGQAWAFLGGGVTCRYPLPAGRALAVFSTAAYTLPNDDVTPLTIPDGDLEVPVLYACDRLVRSARTDAIKRGAPGAWAEGRDDSGYQLRFRTALWMRRRRVVSRIVQAAQ